MADAIKLPEKMVEKLESLLREQATINASYDAQIGVLVETARLCLGVPDGWEMRTTRGGFEPPAETGEDQT